MIVHVLDDRHTIIVVSYVFSPNVVDLEVPTLLMGHVCVSVSMIPHDGIVLVFQFHIKKPSMLCARHCIRRTSIRMQSQALKS